MPKEAKERRRKLLYVNEERLVLLSLQKRRDLSDGIQGDLDLTVEQDTCSTLRRHHLPSVLEGALKKVVCSCLRWIFLARSFFLHVVRGFQVMLIRPHIICVLGRYLQTVDQFFYLSA